MQKHKMSLKNALSVIRPISPTDTHYTEVPADFSSVYKRYSVQWHGSLSVYQACLKQKKESAFQGEKDTMKWKSGKKQLFIFCFSASTYLHSVNTDNERSQTHFHIADMRHAT